MRVFVALITTLLLAGCANMPEALQGVPESAPMPAAVRADPDAFAGERVRWGGRIVEVENTSGETRIAVLARALQGGGRPGDTTAGGRFLARFEGFVDPAEYAAGREITVVGEVVGAETRRIGDYPYRYPVVAVERHVLWAEPAPAPPPRYYDPWYGPYYSPFYPHRYPWYY
ncbi:Slp family lipoprotein [Sediminicurvatus halobius]|uniref:Starvation-inducible protein n=1 Tax=Sediminicurvatus halobius TaxID=2182432 RepID=A0A2U2MVT9_9GAMM|nr:Slp family lipoprotein [Spiribacter halobius]PWG60970.1 hypothetical protein DEM34_18895 [Spiribacter halobius]UEX78673.1 Slp family lipoprotein [Spiribacter halobius]